jgi:hypothetical protein
MSGNRPIHTLRDSLEAARLQAIEELASSLDGAETVSTEGLRRLAVLHMALLAVRDEIAAHAPKLGSGAEEPLH